MPRHSEPDEPDALEDEEFSPQYVDWEPDGEMIPKIIKLLKAHSVHEALLILAAASAEIMKAARGDWDVEKVKSLLET